MGTRWRVVAVTALVLAGGCVADDSGERGESGERGNRGGESVTVGRKAEFGRTVVGLLLDTTLYELEGTLMRKVVNPNKDDESPLADSAVEHPPRPGPHVYDGTLTSEIGVLQGVLGKGKRVKIEGDHVYVGDPEVLILAHEHDGKVYVPVKLFARQFGAYVDVSCSLANCGTIWTKDILAHMRKHGDPRATGMVEAAAEGIIEPIDVRKAPRG